MSYVTTCKLERARAESNYVSNVESQCLRKIRAYIEFNIRSGKMQSIGLGFVLSYFLSKLSNVAV